MPFHRKYPNPLSVGVTGMDVLKQTLCSGKILSERIIQSQFHIPSWAAKLTGFSGRQYSHEYTVIDPQLRTMSLTTKNLNGSSFLRVDEKLTYTPVPEDPTRKLTGDNILV
uniref:PRELI/MSF1 domain-containing protein n=1 Tax=Heterorhabditis bacteriophora TaxID=37862 RepID=A0A1I7W7N9_HETBA